MRAIESPTYAFVEPVISLYLDIVAADSLDALGSDSDFLTGSIQMNESEN